MRRATRFANAVLGGVGLLSLGVLTFAIVRGSSHPLHYIMSLGGLLLVVMISRLSAEARVHTTVLLVASGLSLLAAELGLLLMESGHYSTRFPYEDRRIDAAEAQGVEYDHRTQLQVVGDLNEGGERAVARVSPSDFQPSNGLPFESGRIFPLSGISGRPTVTCNETGQWAVIQSDEHGFRNPRGQYGRETFEVVVVGDSYGFEACLPGGDEVIGPVVRRSGRSLLNLAYGGNGPLIELAALTEYGAPYRPEFVVWLYYEGNDLHNLSGEREAPLLLEYLDPDFSQHLIQRRPQIDRLLLDYHDEVRARFLARRPNIRWPCVLTLCGLRSLAFRPEPTATPPRDSDVEFFARILETARDGARAWDGELVFVYVPSWARYGLTGDRDRLNRRPEVLDEVHELGIPIVDLVEGLEAHEDPLSLFPFRERGHFNPAGYSWLAEQIVDRLNELDVRSEKGIFDQDAGR